MKRRYLLLAAVVAVAMLVTIAGGISISRKRHDDALEVRDYAIEACVDDGTFTRAECRNFAVRGILCDFGAPNCDASWTKHAGVNNCYYDFILDREEFPRGATSQQRNATYRMCEEMMRAGEICYDGAPREVGSTLWPECTSPEQPVARE